MKKICFIILSSAYILISCNNNSNNTGLKPGTYDLDSLTTKNLEVLTNMQADSNKSLVTIGQFFSKLYLKNLIDLKNPDDPNITKESYRQLNYDWSVVDSIIKNNVTISSEILDFNDDSISDLVINTVFNTYNLKTNIFLCDKNNHVTFRRDMNLFNFEKLKDNQFKSQYLGGTMDPNDNKMLYTLIGDSLKLLKHVESLGGYQSDVKDIVVTFYDVTNGISKIKKQYKNPPSILYDTAIWK